MLESRIFRLNQIYLDFIPSQLRSYELKVEGLQSHREGFGLLSFFLGSLQSSPKSPRESKNMPSHDIHDAHGGILA